MTDYRIGDIIYVDAEFDRKEQKSVYRKHVIVGEDEKRLMLNDDNGWTNKRSGKLSLRWHKKTVSFYTGQEIWRMEWVVKNRLGLIDASSRVQDYEKLREIAAIVGYDAQVPEYIIDD